MNPSNSQLPRTAAEPTKPATGPRKPGRVRWWIVWTLFFSTVTNYISRQTFSVLSPMITAQSHLSHTDLARILGAFQLSYGITWLLGGIFLDAVGTRLGLALAVIFWSVVNILTGFANSVFGFASFRFLLGSGKALIGRQPARRWLSGFPARSAASRSPPSIAARALGALWQPWLFPGSRSSSAGVGLLCFPGCLALFGWRCGCAFTTRWTVTRA